MKRYLVFVSDQYYPTGAGDLKFDADTLEEAHELGKKELKVWAYYEVMDTQAESVESAIVG